MLSNVLNISIVPVKCSYLHLSSRVLPFFQEYHDVTLESREGERMN
jgi:hypothetical protein